jgi:hypothetical protein
MIGAPLFCLPHPSLGGIQWLNVYPARSPSPASRRVAFDTRAAAAVDVTYRWTTAAAGNVVTITHSNIRVIS